MNFNLRQIGGGLLSIALLLTSSCDRDKEREEDRPTPQQSNVVRMQASIEGTATSAARASIEPRSGSLNYSVKFTKGDKIQLFVKQNGTLHTIGTVSPTFVGESGQVCHFEFTLPSNVSRSEQMTIIGVNGATTKVEGNKVYLTTNRITAPLSNFTPPIAFVLEGANVKDEAVVVNAKFEHLGVYEAIRIKNESGQSATFNIELVDEKGEKLWRREGNSLWVVSEKRFETKSKPENLITDITINSGATEVLYHWYLLTDETQQIPSLIKMKGKAGSESDLLSANMQSSASSQQFKKGHIYHAYATYKGGKKLYFVDKEGSEKMIPVESISLSESKKVLAVGDNFTLTTTILPTEASNKEVTWQASPADIVTVENGKVTAKKAGVVTITATSKESNKKATCQVIVLNKSADDVTGVEL